MEIPFSKTKSQFFDERVDYNSHFSVILTSYCNISCRHCMPESGPSAKRKTLGIDDLANVIRGLATTQTTKNVCFTGGEPLTHPNLLKQATKLCQENGLNVTVMTNGFWAKSVTIAKEIISQYYNLVHIGFSTDRFHLEFLPIDVIINGINACYEMGVTCSVRVSYLDSFQEEISYIESLLSEVSGKYVLEHQPVQEYGRAAKEVDPNDLLSLSTKSTICASADVHALNFDGSVFACCGPSINWGSANPLHLGNVKVEKIEDILASTQKNAILQIIRIWGPLKVFLLAKDYALRNNIEYSIDIEQRTMCKMCEQVTNDPITLELINRMIKEEGLLTKIRLKRMLDFGEV